LPSVKLLIDIVFIASVIIAVALSAIILARVLPSYLPAAMQGAIPTEDPVELKLSDPDAEPLPQGDFEEFSGSQEAQPEMLMVITTDSAVSDPLQDSAPVILPITWGAVAGTLIWRGKVRSQWHRQGYDYDTFRLVAKMRGSATRVELLNAITETPKNKLQLAKELGVDWKTVDNHIEMLLKNGLVEEKMSIGTSRYYGATKNAGRILLLLSSDASAAEDPESGDGRLL
jgi:DNA-binding transcriptional ArsR family regulator